MVSVSEKGTYLLSLQSFVIKMEKGERGVDIWKHVKKGVLEVNWNKKFLNKVHMIRWWA